jgi:hypothetical protein
MDKDLRILDPVVVSTVMASSRSLIPKVNFQRDSDPRQEFKELFNRDSTSKGNVKDKNLGTRVFYFNEEAMENCKTLDHPHPSEDGEDKLKTRREDLKTGRAVEAGTIVDITDYTVASTEEQYFIIVVQWDCGCVKCYMEAEFDCLRVFDLGPTGIRCVCVYVHVRAVGTAMAWPCRFLGKFDINLLVLPLHQLPMLSVGRVL